MLTIICGIEEVICLATSKHLVSGPTVASLLQVVFECPICLESYDTNERRPRTLSCGHSHCTDCITQLIYQYGGLVTCAFCRKQHSTRVNAATKIPVNYAIDEVLQQRQY